MIIIFYLVIIYYKMSNYEIDISSMSLDELVILLNNLKQQCCILDDANVDPIEVNKFNILFDKVEDKISILKK